MLKNKKLFIFEALIAIAAFSLCIWYLNFQTRFCFWFLDASYYFDGAYRYSIGQIPHVDFETPLPWANFILLGSWFKIFSTSFFTFRYFLLAQQSILFWLSYVTLRRSKISLIISLAVSSALIVVAAPLPFPWFDNNAWFFVVLGALLLFYKNSFIYCLGLFCLLSACLFKQNYFAGSLILFIAGFLLRSDKDKNFYINLFLIFFMWIMLFFYNYAEHAKIIYDQLIVDAIRFKGSPIEKIRPTFMSMIHGDSSIGFRYFNLLMGQGLVFILGIFVAINVFKSKILNITKKTCIILFFAGLFGTYFSALLSQNNASFPSLGIGVLAITIGVLYLHSISLLNLNFYLRQVIPGLILIMIFTVIFYRLPETLTNCRATGFGTAASSQRLPISSGPFSDVYAKGDMLNELTALDKVIPKNSKDLTMFSFPNNAMIGDSYHFKPWGKWIHFLKNQQTFEEDYKELNEILGTNQKPDYVLLNTERIGCATPLSSELTHVPELIKLLNNCQIIYNGQIFKLFKCHK